MTGSEKAAKARRCRVTIQTPRDRGDRPTSVEQSQRIITSGPAGIARAPRPTTRRPPRGMLFCGLCGLCGPRMEGSWSNHRIHFPLPGPHPRRRRRVDVGPTRLAAQRQRSPDGM